MKKIITILVLACTLGVYAQEESADFVQESFAPIPGYTYIISAWVKDDITTQVKDYQGHIKIVNTQDDGSIEDYTFNATGNIIDGWQRIIGEFRLNKENTADLQIKLISMPSGTSFFDDVRFFPYNGNMKSFVYDPITQRLMAELDENNYATLYEYDKEGGLVRVKKETERGVFTIQETRSGNSKISN